MKHIESWTYRGHKIEIHIRETGHIWVAVSGPDYTASNDFITGLSSHEIKKIIDRAIERKE